MGNERTLTFFEMLGNFSVGDYFIRDAVAFAWEFLTQVVKLPAERLHPTVHPEDNEAPRRWSEIAGISDDGIVRLEDNWWGLRERQAHVAKIPRFTTIEVSSMAVVGPIANLGVIASASWRSGTLFLWNSTRTSMVLADRRPEKILILD